MPLQWMVVLQRAPQPHKLAVTKKAEPTWADTTLACPHPGAQLSPLASSRDQRRVGGGGASPRPLLGLCPQHRPRAGCNISDASLKGRRWCKASCYSTTARLRSGCHQMSPPKPQGSPPSPLPSSCSHVSLRPLQTQTSKELLGDEAGVGETGPSPCHTAPGMSARLAASAGTRFCDRD